ncbi:MAG: ParB/RepB/Spo0J family partition protein [Oscillospiraceae bacterium]|nr:ParB/RepB/Spo0J family partition protein [Oscillospiraceae bacterium]
MAAKDKKGLGTGLAALFADADIMQDDAPLKMVAIEKIEPRADQPRKYFDEESLSVLAASISEYGLIQPITVRALDNGYYQIVAGERRWRASRMAGLSELPVRIVDADDIRTAQLALVENLQREDLNPIEEAEGYRKLIDEFSMTQDEAAKSVGRSRPAIANSLRLLTLSPKVLSLVSDGSLSAGHARALLSITDPELQAMAADSVIKKGLSVRKTEQLAAAAVKTANEAAEIREKELKVDYAAEVSKTLTESLGRKVTLKESRTGGKIELQYYSDDDRETLIDLLYKLKDIL